MTKMLQSLFGLLAVALVSCNGDGSGSSNTFAFSSEVTDKFAQEATTFVVGDDVLVSAKLRNLEDVETVIEFGPPLISIQIYSEDGETLIYDPFFGLGLPAVIVQTSIGPFGEIRRVLEWTGVDNTGAPVSPGRYEVRVRVGLFDTQNNEFIVYGESTVIELV